MNMKTMISYRMAILKSLQITNASEDVAKKGTLLHCWWECVGAATAEDSMEVLQKTESTTII